MSARPGNVWWIGYVRGAWRVGRGVNWVEYPTKKRAERVFLKALAERSTE